MTAWQVYWVMQLDSIGMVLSAISVGASSGAVVMLFFGALVTERGYYASERQDESWKRIKVTAIRLVIASLCAGAASAFIPSTKTAAAMIVLPAITSESATSVVAPEARELYDLAKDALKHAAGKDAKKKD